MAGRLMRAVVYEGYGGGAAKLKHVEVPIPSPRKDEVLLKMEATSVNPFDWKMQTGRMRENLKVGDKVVSVLSYGGGGGFSEYAVASKDLTVKRPPEVSAAEGAGLPIAGLTALQALTDSARIKLDGTAKPTNILITAASGGVGHYAVQLAKLGNAHVTVTCGARNADFLKSLGADEVLNYNTAQGAALTSPSGKKYDYVIHCTTGIPFSTFEPNLNRNGKVIDLTPGPRTMLNFVFQKFTFSKKQIVPLLVMPKSEKLEYMIELVKEGKLKTIIDSTHPLKKAEDAWEKSIDGHATGKIIVEH
ncbi:hypothetical protein C5167_023905 [Papaver somniferum]|uniref:Enoyl reductase (ER) domain-containing protein n=1 Tax=Papaver somniferum TaxID=3469 RepID=A0A4Y7JQ26_PAPSO|nr:hypothetical protein C5167_023905 [Papaver somniferum]